MNGYAITILILIFIAGLVLGAFYFISLWQTLRKLPRVESRARLYVISYLLRLTVVLGAFYFLMAGNWERLAAAMIGFLVMRKILTHHFGPQKTAEAIR